jgi:hypothetical protein
MSQENYGISYPYDWAKEDPIEAYWTAHGQAAFWDMRPDPAADPWVNGRYALAAMVWGLILMLVVSVAA